MTITWQKELARGIRDPHELIKLLNISPEQVSLAAHQDFQTRVPLGFISRMEKGNPNDPLLRQILPVIQETEVKNNYFLDPLEEKKFNKIPGLIHKYHGRILLTLTGSCAINCRYCFRRHFNYKENQLNPQVLQIWEEYIKKDINITEIIYSGGDPLLLTDKSLEKISVMLTNLPQITTLRIHSRLPIVLPERMTDNLIKILSKLPVKVIFILHCNHPNEIDQAVINSLEKLKKANILVLNQAVLLQNINNSADILLKLNQKLFQYNILPYYLHLPDKVQGTAHFDVDLKQAKEILRELQIKLPGYLVPKLVREDPNIPFKAYA